MLTTPNPITRRKAGASLIAKAVGFYITARHGEPSLEFSSRERGLSQSTENAVLLTGGVALALVVLAIVGSFVKNKLGELGA